MSCTSNQFVNTTAWLLQSNSIWLPKHNFKNTAIWVITTSMLPVTFKKSKKPLTSESSDHELFSDWKKKFEDSQSALPHIKLILYAMYNIRMVNISQHTNITWNFFPTDELTTMECKYCIYLNRRWFCILDDPSLRNMATHKMWFYVLSSYTYYMKICEG